VTKDDIRKMMEIGEQALAEANFVRADQLMVHPGWLKNPVMRQLVEGLEHHGAEVYIVADISKPGVRLKDWLRTHKE
jgi:hypothetical protein